MPKFDNIPNEILTKIFEHVWEDDYSNQDSLAQCALTCRSWRLPAQEQFFKTIKIVGKKDLLKIEPFMKESSFGLFMRKVLYEFDHDKPEEDIDSVLRLIDQLFPRLEVSKYDNYCTKEPLMVYRMMLAGKFRSLRQVPVFEISGGCNKSHNDEQEDSSLEEIIRLLT